MSVDMSGDALTATMHVAHLSGGTLTMPPGLNSVVIEIGCSDRDTMDDWELDTYFPNSFLLSFEPLVDKYALLLAKGTRRFVGHKRDAGVPLGRHHQRGIVLPLAVSPAGGAINFTVSRVAGCSSMAQIHPNSRYKSVLRGWGLNCEEGLERRIVPSITLEQALRLTGELPVLRLKIDAQGVDLQLVRSVPPAYFTRRVETVELEFASDACKDKPLYVGQASASEVSAYLASLGYSKTFTAESAAGCEVRAAHTSPARECQGTVDARLLLWISGMCLCGVAHTMPGCRHSAALPCSCSRLLVCVRARTGDTDLSAQGERAWQAVAPPAPCRTAVA